MATRIIKCRIKIGKDSKNPAKRVYSVAIKEGAKIWVPWGFQCGDKSCRDVTRGEYRMHLSGNLKAVSCPSCYGDNVYLTAIKLIEQTRRVQA